MLTPEALRVLKMAIESSEANECRSKCLKRIYLTESVGEYLETRASAEDMVHSMDVRSGSQLNRRKVIEKVMGRPGKGLPSRSICLGDLHGEAG